MDFPSRDSPLTRPVDFMYVFRDWILLPPSPIQICAPTNLQNPHDEQEAIIGWMRTNSSLGWKFLGDRN